MRMVNQVSGLADLLLVVSLAHMRNEHIMPSTLLRSYVGHKGKTTEVSAVVFPCVCVIG